MREHIVSNDQIGPSSLRDQNRAPFARRRISTTRRDSLLDGDLRDIRRRLDAQAGMRFATKFRSR